MEVCLVKMSLMRLAAAIVGATIGTGCTSSTSAPSTPGGVTTITFGGLTADGPVTIYAENGYSISASGAWQAKTTYGNPAPMIQFVTPGGTMSSASVQAFANDHAPFSFRSVDVYSSVTRIPYTISGVRDFATVFVMTDTLPNTFGNFRTVTSTHASDLIDSLTIELTNPTTFVPNPMGVDNIVLSR
jgi:hypothetical protein